jgi:uncharacterized membrane protein YtjA (UPF0391 family)
VARAVLFAVSRPGDRAVASNTGAVAMLHYAAVFFVIALVAAVFGFGGLAAGAAGIAKILFFVALAVAIVSFLAHSRSSSP